MRTITAKPEPGGLRKGIGDALREWRLVLSSSAIGALLGAVPGVGASVIDWIAYGRAAKKPGNDVPFGEGNIRGVIAPESANNAKEGGALIPTVAFGIPGSAGMAILLGAFMIQGLVPGPRMLTDHAPLLVSMILSIALANIVGAVLCLGLTGQLAKIALVPARVLAPMALVFVTLGAFQNHKDAFDLGLLIAFGALGIVMRHLNWPRVAFALGFVLGPNLERFSFLTTQISGWSWLMQPVALILLALTLFTVFQRRKTWRKAAALATTHAYPRLDTVFTILRGAVAAYIVATAASFPFAAGIFPIVSAGLMLALVLVKLLGSFTSKPNGSAVAVSKPELVTDLAFLLPALGIAVIILAFGHIAASMLFLLAAGVWYGGDKLHWLGLRALAVTVAVYAIFDLLLTQSWPRPWVFLAF